MKKVENICGWSGMLFVQSATLPVTYNILMGNNTSLPPISMVILIWVGLILYLIRAVLQKDVVHITSNFVGFISQSILMSLILLK